ncbi:ATP-dependent helicase [Paenibacillus sp. DR312]|uniref:ATP-dependent helicase n=1 Tax=Paenibacillus sp. DR312 TaxID=2871175 RepID=UPI001C987264|nr:ATP-dependent helicase [Paenibacillus sp. DR312]QZN77665.1 ATP-dependent helicase [Paenibacillus sp. DR312]
MRGTYQRKLAEIMKDEQQFEAFSSLDNTVVLAGPGSGKTTVLTMKIIKLLSENIKVPRGLACLTYSNEAAKEFKKRLKVLGLEERNNVFLGTVHSFCIAEIITPFAHLYQQYGIPLPLKIISAQKKGTLFKQVKEELGIPDKQLSITEMDKERSLNIEGSSLINIPSYDLAKRAAIDYEKKLTLLKYVDFVSIINFATQLIQNESYILKCLESKFSWFLVDEYQDLGRPLHEMILSMLEKVSSSFFAVGDPDQSIYGFNGGVPDYLMELYNLPGIRQVKLQTNYRSNQGIIDASEIALNSKVSRNYIAGTRGGEIAQFNFQVCDMDMIDQYYYVAEKIVPQNLSLGVSYSEIAVLVANNNQINALVEIFSEKGIPYYVAKHGFERTPVVNWLEDCVAWLIGKENISFDGLFKFWRDLLIKHNKMHFSDSQTMIEKKKLHHILIESLSNGELLINWLNFVLQKLNFEELLRLSEIYPDELENLNNLMKVVREGKFLNATINSFTQIGKPDNQITISTRHSSKGLEFETVVLLGMEEGSFPSYRSKTEREIMEEHRIFFVCVSRAKSRCYLVRSNFLNGYPKKASVFWTLLYKWYHEKFK